MSELNKLGAASGLEVSTAVNQITEEVNGINIEGGGTGGSTNAADITVSAEAEFYSGKDVETALQEIGSDLTEKGEGLQEYSEQLKAHDDTLNNHDKAIVSNTEEIEKLKENSGGVSAGDAVALSLIFG